MTEQEIADNTAAINLVFRTLWPDITYTIQHYAHFSMARQGVALKPYVGIYLRNPNARVQISWQRNGKPCWAGAPTAEEAIKEVQRLRQ